MEQIRSLAKVDRRQISEQVFAEIRPYLGSDDGDELQELRRRAQDQRAKLIYEGARHFADVQYAAVTMLEQWAIAKFELIVSRSALTHILAERRCKAVEDFLRDNLDELHL